MKQQKSYKELIIKLLATTIGLLAMLSCAVFIGQNFKNQHMKKNLTAENLKSKITVEQKFGIVSDARPWGEGHTLDGIKSADTNIRELVTLHAIRVQVLHRSIEDITAQENIPNGLKENIVSELKLQLVQAEKELSNLEMLTLFVSDNTTIPLSHDVKTYQCNQSNDEITPVSKSHRSIEAFSWI
ncbi:MAG: hypothetical protein K9G26_03865 [Emcibacter sp.]|nr:hypothetical protein [Emcibacter sp.]